MCPESALLRNLVTHLLLRESEVLIMDMDAGFEHIGRGTAQAVDAFIVVVEPGKRSIQTASSIRGLTKDLGIERVYVVGSKTRDDAERQFVTDNLPDFELLGFINYNREIIEADLKGIGVFDAAPKAVEEARAIKERLEEVYKTKNE